jgi:hypothetical protein
MDRGLASVSPDATAAALRLLKVLEECGQMSPAEAKAARRRITGWARFLHVQEPEQRDPPPGERTA